MKLLLTTALLSGLAAAHWDSHPHQKKLHAHKKSSSKGKTATTYDGELTMPDPWTGSAYSYDGDTGPSEWPTLFPDACAGASQSPIYLDPSTASSGNLNSRPIAFNYTNPYPVSITNKGNHIDLTFGNDSSLNTIEITTQSGVRKTFKLLGCHFHSHSEHAIAGMSAVIEAHWVHQADDGELAVLGTMYEKGDEPNAFFPDELEGFLPIGYKQKFTFNSPSPYFSDFTAIFPSSQSHYTYPGSLTTPPCTEGLSWNVFAESVKLSSQQYYHLLKINEHFLNYANRAGATNRPLQQLNGRTPTYWN